MVSGNTFLICSSAGFLVMCVSTTYKTALMANTEMMTAKLKENMMNNSEPITEVIIIANNEMGKPIIIARFRMFL